MDLSGWRKRIDTIDRQILDLLNQRADSVLHLAPLKREQAIPVHAPGRENEVLAKLEAHNQGPLTSQALRGIFECIMKEMRAIQNAPARQTEPNAEGKEPSAR